MRIRGELHPAKRLLLSMLSVAVFFALWFLLTLPMLPPSDDSSFELHTDALPNTAADALVDDYSRQQEQPKLRPIVAPIILPSPFAVLKALAYLHTEQALVRSAAVSLWRITVSFLLAALVAIPLGLLMATYPPIRNAIEPLTGPLRYLPISAIVPLFILWFGIGEEQKIAFLFVAVVVYLIPLVIESVDNVDQTYLDTAYTLGARPRDIILRVLLPGAWPGIFESCRVLYGVGWTYVILAEIINARYGLGYMINQAAKRSHIDWIYALILVVLLLGIGTNWIFVATGRRLFAWRQA